MINLPTITVCCITTKDYGPSIAALHETLKHINPAQVLYFSDIQYRDERIEWVAIKPFRSVQDYNHFVFKTLVDYVKTDHILVVQHDGYVLHADGWTDEFLNYDYIGAPWAYTDGRNVGNGGFSLRSRKLHLVLQNDEFEYTSPEDEKICRYYRQTLEKKYGIKFAPEDLAHRFSYEMHAPRQRTFGFHNNAMRWRPPIILQRKGCCLGDLLMMEPVMERLHSDGYHVVLDVPEHLMGLLSTHPFPIEHVNHSQFDLSEAKIVNMEMAYEVLPKQLALKSYYETCGITDGLLRNAKLHFEIPKDAKLFSKYVVLHNDPTDMPHRNIHGFDWDELARYIEVFLGYPVYRIGKGAGEGGQHMNCHNERFMAYVIGGADYFIGIDSGPSHIAVAMGVRSMIFFGSVNPAYRHADLSKIKVMQKSCPINNDHCYHNAISTIGVKCTVLGGEQSPPCTTWHYHQVKSEIDKFIK